MNTLIAFFCAIGYLRVLVVVFTNHIVDSLACLNSGNVPTLGCVLLLLFFMLLSVLHVSMYSQLRTVPNTSAPAVLRTVYAYANITSLPICTIVIIDWWGAACPWLPKIRGLVSAAVYFFSNAGCRLSNPPWFVGQSPTPYAILVCTKILPSQIQFPQVLIFYSDNCYLRYEN